MVCIGYISRSLVGLEDTHTAIYSNWQEDIPGLLALSILLKRLEQHSLSCLEEFESYCNCPQGAMLCQDLMVSFASPIFLGRMPVIQMVNSILSKSSKSAILVNISRVQ